MGDCICYSNYHVLWSICNRSLDPAFKFFGYATALYELITVTLSTSVRPHVKKICTFVVKANSLKLKATKRLIKKPRGHRAIVLEGYE